MPEREVSVRVIGSTSSLVNYVVKTVAKNVKAKLEEAKKASEELVERAYLEALREAEDRVRRTLREVRERIESYRASRDVELKKELTRLKLKATEEVLGEAVRVFREKVPLETYKRFLEKVYREAVERASIHSRELVVVPAPADRSLIAEIAARATPPDVRVTISEEIVDAVGGFILKSSDGKLTLDYRVEALLAPALEEARLVVLKTLFQG